MTLPSGWTQAPIGSLCTLINGRAFKPNEWSTSGLKIIRIQNLNREDAKFNLYDGMVEDKHLVEPGDLLFAWSGTPGTSFGAHIWCGQQAILNQHIFKVVYRKELFDREFFRLAINSRLDELIGKAHGGAGLAHVTKGRFEETTVKFPPPAEQRRIITRLNGLTARTTCARAELGRVAVGCDRLRTTTLRQAVTGTLTQMWREQTTNSEAVSKLLKRTPIPIQGRGGREATDKVIPGRGGLSINDPGSEVPSGWQWVPLLRVAKQETGHTPSRLQPSYWDGGVPWVGIRDAGAHHGQRISKTIQTISDEGLANSSARLLPAGTVCLSRTASVGYVTILGRPMATSQDFATWTCGSALLPEYLMLALLAEGDDIRKFGMGSTHTTIYFPEIRALHIALPPLEEQCEIIARVEAAFARADRLEAEAARATALLDRLEASILVKAFQGELVPQDPADEPASALLDSIRTERTTTLQAKRGRGAAKHAEVR